MVFAFLTVVVTVHAISHQGGVYMFGRMLPVWVVILIEFCCAYGLEIIMGSPCSFKLAVRIFDPQNTHPVLFETTIICATVGLMCPAMSFLAASRLLSSHSCFLSSR